MSSKPARLQMLEELQELSARYGRASIGRESVYFHVTRAKGTFDAILLANPMAEDYQVMNRLLHLSAVCLRMAMAWNGEETG